MITIVSPRLNESPLSLCATQSCSATTFIGSGGSAAFTDGAGGGFVPPAIDTLRLSGLAPFMISSAVDPRSIEAAGVPRLATEPEGVRGSATEPASSTNEKRERTAQVKGVQANTYLQPPESVARATGGDGPPSPLYSLTNIRSASPTPDGVLVA